ncbi:hypothetical protein AMS68_001064 [Peltaster fructicola]|uniref:protein-tyrosine-phosphatase n=1 Tax=Peltaster fructicola TaxID=286661 RepID=A0A6H0XLB9_9PEZI|nr:hypothetical protein AMS68_001064 [Peltaster fructicola]
MPYPSRASVQDAANLTSYGSVIEYIENRLYLASYTHAPDENTPFPYPAKRSSKRSAKTRDAPVAQNESQAPPLYFSVDRSLLYNAFHADFGPLHIGHLYRFAVQFHEVLAQQEQSTELRPVVFWSDADAKSRANAACLLATYMVLIQSWPPHLALAPIAQMDPPCMPFRDAGYSQADYGLTVQDVVYGVWKAKEEGLVGLKDFSLEEYERYERVDQGDFNWITPSFLAFASPQHQPTHEITPADPLYNTLPRSIAAVQKDKTMPTPFKNVLTHFVERGIGMVVRLNSELYSSSSFSALGIKHYDMIFDDGTCPTLSLVRRFIGMAHSMINDKRKGIAVHCKAGLGRTGCLIGAYLIYRHGFTANEVISFMRFMRPGMVVGPQQHWLHLNQGTFREWWFEDTMREKIMASMQPATPTRLQQSSKRLLSSGQTFTPPHADRQHTSPRRPALGEITNNESYGSYRSVEDYKSSVGVADENLPAPTPGQPRKTSKLYSTRQMLGESISVKPETEIITMARSTIGEAAESESDYATRSQTLRASRSPANRNSQRRAISCVTTTTTTTKWDGLNDGSDSENNPMCGNELLLDDASPSRPKTPNVRSGNGSGALSIGKRSSPSRRSTEGKTSVRKTSGRVGSIAAQSTTRAHKAS